MSDADFRWRSFFQRSSEPLFVLNRQRYLLFVNRAFEELTRLPASQVHRMSCRRPAPARPGQSWKTVLKHVLTPPDEVLAGQAGRHRRLLPARSDRPACWWDVDFFPLMDARGCRGVLGKITPGAEVPEPISLLVPEEALHLRQQRIEQLNQVYLGLRLPALRRVAEQLRVAAQTRCPVTFVGQAGTGKKTLARLIHQRGPDQELSFAALDCRRLPFFTLTTLLWGDSGALARAPLATVYLREPGALPREVQEQLHAWLTAPESGDQPRPRVIAGFSTDPLELVRSGVLLEELAQALTTFRIDLPTLAERRDDLPHLVDRLLRRMQGDGGKAIAFLTPDAWELLLTYSWPGNLRELYNVLQGAREVSANDAIDAEDFPAYIRQVVKLAQVPASRLEKPIPVRAILEQVERRLIELALKRARGKKNQAARLLGVPQPWLFRRLKDLDIEKGEGPEAEPS